MIRVEALQARRAKDAQSKRAASVRPQSTGPYLSSRTPAPGNSSDETPHELSVHATGELDGHSLIKLEVSHEADEDALARGENCSADELSSDEGDSDSGGDAGADETFFAPERRYRRRRSSIEPVHQPTALANPALRHLYDATPAPEKPHLPLRGIVRSLPPAPASDEEGEDNAGSASPSESGDRSQHTPEPRDASPETGKSPSSAQRLLSYLGSFVRRSPAASPSSTRAAPRSPDSSSPEATPERPEMKQVSQQSAIPSLAGVRGERTSKPLPPISDRKILPLPPSHVSVTFTPAPQAAADASYDQSFSAADTTAQSSSVFVPLAFRRRRRSSNSAGPGERSLVWDVVNAIEEAESSREEEEARIVELLQNTSGTGGGGIKRRAAAGDLRVATATDPTFDGKAKGKGKTVDWRGFVEIDRELERVFVPTGTRALDRRVSGEKRATRR